MCHPSQKDIIKNRNSTSLFNYLVIPKHINMSCRRQRQQFGDIIYSYPLCEVEVMKTGRYCKLTHGCIEILLWWVPHNYVVEILELFHIPILRKYQRNMSSRLRKNETLESKFLENLEKMFSRYRKQLFSYGLLYEQFSVSRGGVFSTAMMQFACSKLHYLLRWWQIPYNRSYTIYYQ